MQSNNYVSIKQTYCAMKTIKAYFNNHSKLKPTKTNAPFRTDREVENETSNAQPYTKEEEDHLIEENGEYGSACGSNQHIAVNSRPDLSYTIHRLGYFSMIPFQLGHMLTHKTMCYPTYTTI